MSDDGIYHDFSGAELNPVPEAQPEPFTITPELQAALDNAIRTINARSFSERHPELGKMIKCQVCGRRHRASEKHEQVFTYRVGDYELFRENDKGDLVPDYRTAIPANDNPTAKQVVGAAAFAKKRFHPHHSKIKLQFIERTRLVFEDMGFDIDDDDKEKFEKNLQRARVEAARQLRKERAARRKVAHRRQDVSRRINRGFLVGGSR